MPCLQVPTYYDIGGVSSVTPLLCSGEGIVVVAEKWRVPDPGKLSAVAGGIVSGAEIGHHVVPSGPYYDIGDAVGAPPGGRGGGLDAGHAL